jgi:hypothetical protein
VRRQDAAKYAREKDFEFSCCYEHYGLSVRQEESAEMERHLLRRRFQVFPHGFMVRLGGESGKCFDCPVLRLGGTWLFPLSSHKLVQICCSTPLCLNDFIYDAMYLLNLN